MRPEKPWQGHTYFAHVLLQLLTCKWVRIVRVGKKSTKNEVMLRIDTVYGMLCDGKSRTDILRHCAEIWDISERQGENYIARGREKLEEDCRMTREAFMAEALAGYRSLREQAERRGQLMCAKQCIDSMVDLTAIKK